MCITIGHGEMYGHFNGCVVMKTTYMKHMLENVQFIALIIVTYLTKVIVDWSQGESCQVPYA